MSMFTSPIARCGHDQISHFTASKDPRSRHIKCAY